MSRAKNWCATWNNYDDRDIAELEQFASECTYLIYGKEISSTGTPHLQVFFQLRNRKRLQQLKDALGIVPHFEVTRNVQGSITYCKKDGDFMEFGNPPAASGRRNDLEQFKDTVKRGVLNPKMLREAHSTVFAKYPSWCYAYIQDHAPKRTLPDHDQLYPWQEELLQVLDGVPDNRKIYFVVGISGNNGKSWFCHKYAETHDDCQILVPGKVADMAYMLRCDIRVLFMDCPRSKQGEYIQYGFLEHVKDGYVPSGKYESMNKTIGECHVVVFMNEHPDPLALSADRYEVIEV
jgi:hypothetical protein